MALTASGQISLTDIIQEFTNSTDGTEVATCAGASFSGQAVINLTSTANLCVGMRSVTTHTNAYIVSIPAQGGSVTLSENLNSTLLDTNQITFEANRLTDFYSGGPIGVSASGAPNVPTSGEIQLTDFYSASAAIDFPDSTYSVREFDGTFATGYSNIVTDDAAFEFRHSDAGQGLALSQTLCFFRVERDSGGFDFDVYAPAAWNNTEQNKINSSGTSSAISNDTWTTVVTGTVQPTSFKWENPNTVGGSGSQGNGTSVMGADSPTSSQQTYDVAENTYQSLSVGETGCWYASSNATMETVGTEFNTAAFEITVTMRRSGYNDTQTIRVCCCMQNTATATSGGILGK